MGKYTIDIKHKVVQGMMTPVSCFSTSLFASLAYYNGRDSVHVLAWHKNFFFSVGKLKGRSWYIGFVQIIRTLNILLSSEIT